jgi:hypothetical protein
MYTGTMSADPWGGIERHLTLYDYANNSLSDRFFSYAHDNSDGNKYEGRLVAPANPFIKLGKGITSRIAYSVYEGGHWFTHISIPGGQGDQWTLKDQFLWDIRDLNGDGFDEIIMSPARYSNDPDVPGYYYVKWETNVYHWNEGSKSLVNIKSYKGIPYLSPFFREEKKTTTAGYFYPVQTVYQNSKIQMILLGSDKKIKTEEF